MKISTILTLLLLFFHYSFSQADESYFEFEYEGVSLHGVLNLPQSDSVKGLVLIIHGSGRTQAVAQNMHGDVRMSLVEAGYATYMWDKMGCGKSGGTFDYNQTVQSSADEAIAAIYALQQHKIPGSEEIGLWGISRAGWINPLIINQYKDIKFWISVSGVDDKENFNYLFEENLRIGGMPEDSIQLLSEELKEGARISHTGGSYENYLAATQHLWKNAFWLRFNQTSQPNETGYYAFQKDFMEEKMDSLTGLMVYVPGFDSILSQVNCPVLAIFGEKDKNVDWQKTKALYESTLGKRVDLSIKSFPNGNHNLFQCHTGGFYEFQDEKLPWNRCEGFLDAMKNWIRKLD